MCNSTESNDEFEFPDSSYSVSGVKYIVKMQKTSTNPPIHIYIDRVINRLVFKRKDG